MYCPPITEVLFASAHRSRQAPTYTGTTVSTSSYQRKVHRAERMVWKVCPQNLDRPLDKQQRSAGTLPRHQRPCLWTTMNVLISYIPTSRRLAPCPKRSLPSKDRVLGRVEKRTKEHIAIRCPNGFHLFDSNHWRDHTGWTLDRASRLCESEKSDCSGTDDLKEIAAAKEGLETMYRYVHAGGTAYLQLL